MDHSEPAATEDLIDRMPTFTEIQQQQLSRIEENDLAIILTSSLGRNMLVCVTDVHYHYPGISPPRITVVDVSSQTPRFPIEFQTYTLRHAPAQSPELPRDLRDYLSAQSDIILRPSIAQVRQYAYAEGCPYAECVEGLVSISSGTGSRSLDISVRPQDKVWNLCPLCMGPQLFQRHQQLMERRLHHPNTVNVEAENVHVVDVDVRRTALGYPHLPLDFPAQRAPLTMVSKIQRAQKRRLSWYLESGNYELEQCSICLADYGEEESDTHITELPCGHLCHRACIESWAAVAREMVELRGTSPLRCPGVTSM